ncbi:hypothetical protein Dimus_017698 [Dionaea muscipula]
MENKSAGKLNENEIGGVSVTYMFDFSTNRAPIPAKLGGKSVEFSAVDSPEPHLSIAFLARRSLSLHLGLLLVVGAGRTAAEEVDSSSKMKQLQAGTEEIPRASLPVALPISSLTSFSIVISLCRLRVMDNIVDALNNAYQEFLGAVATVFEAREVSGSQKTAATDAALENFKQRWELFRVACDQAEEFVETIKQRIGSECLVDEATGSMAGKPGQAIPPGLPPISAVRLEQMSKAVRWLVIELQQGSGAAGGSSHTHSTAPFDARFSDDATQ